MKKKAPSVNERVRVDLIPISALEKGLVQNPSRQLGAALKIIQASMEEIGQLAPILVKQRGAKFVIADGHRRVQAARNIGWGAVYANIYNGPLTEPELWAAANGSTRGIKGQDWFYGWAMETSEGGDPEAFLARMNKHTAQHIRSTISLFGKNRSVELGSTGKISPVLSSFVSIVYSNMKGRLGDSMKLKPKDVGEWMVKHGSGIRKLIGLNPPLGVLKKLHTAMVHGKPFPRGEWG